MLEVLFHPSMAFEKLRERSSFLQASVLILGAWLNLLLSIFILSGITMSGVKFFLIALTTGILYFAVVLGKTMVLHFTAEVSGGKSNLIALLTSFGYSHLPLHLSLPITLLLHPIFPAFAWLGIIVLLFWTGRLGFVAIRKNYSFSPLKTFLIALSPSFLIFLLVAAMTLFFLAVIFSN